MLFITLTEENNNSLRYGLTSTLTEYKRKEKAHEPPCSSKHSLRNQIIMSNRHSPATAPPPSCQLSLDLRLKNIEHEKNRKQEKPEMATPKTKKEKHFF